MADRRSLSGISILVVDDDADSRAILEWFLTIHGASVISAESAAEALSIVDAKPPDFLLSDIGLPDTDGHELLVQIREKLPSIPAVAVSAFASPEYRQKSLLAGFQFHITKPVDFSELMASVATAVGRTPIN